MALSIYEVIKGISQAISNKHHGAIDEDGRAVEIGLKREDQPITDQQVMDGFGVALHGNLLLLRYNSSEPIQTLHNKRFEQEMERRINDIKNHIVKEFNKHTGETLRLKEAGDIKILVETANRMKAIIKVQMPYEVLNLKQISPIGTGSEDAAAKLLANAAHFKKLEKGKLKPRNVSVKVK